MGKNIVIPMVKIQQKTNQMGFLRILRKYKFLYLMITPVLAYYILFSYVPMYGLIVAFKDFNPFRGILDSPWVGFKYFHQVFTDDYFWRVTRNTILISLYKVLFSFPAPIILALLLNLMLNERFKRFVQTIIYLPHFISWVIVSGIILNFLSIQGIVNHFLSILGYNPTAFMIKSQYFRSIIVLSDIWKNMGWGTIIYIAAITGVNMELYEAAYVDGANRWKQTWHVTLPGIRSSIVMMFILSLANILNAGFDQVFVLSNQLVYDVGDIIDTYVYRVGLQTGQISYAAVVGFFKSIIGMILILTLDKFFKNIGEEGIL